MYMEGRPTGNVLIQDIILLDDIVEQLATGLVQNEDFPLLKSLSQVNQK